MTKMDCTRQCAGRRGEPGPSNKLGLLPPPLWGRVGEGGSCCSPRSTQLPPPSPAPPHKGEGSLAESVAPLRHSLSMCYVILQLPSLGGAMISMSSFLSGTVPSAS